MNKQEYLQKLSQALSALTEQEKEAALLFCTEMLEDRMESGMTEEEAVAAMEDADTLARQLTADVQKSAAPRQETPRPDFTEWQKMQITCPAERLNHIDLQAGNMGIKMLLSPDDQVRLTYFTRAQNVYEAKVEGDTLLLREVKDESRRSLFHFFVHIGGPKVEITLEVPRDMMANLKAFTKNGGISLQGPQMLMRVEMGTTNGGLSVSDVQCISLDAHTTNGGMAIANTATRQQFSFHTTNGGIAARDCQSGGDMTLGTTNGGVSVQNLQAQQALSVSSTNGGVKVGGLDAASIRLRTSNSPISGTVKGPQSLWQIESRTTNGRNSLPTWQEGQKPLSVHTTNSPIHVSFE